MRDRWDRRRVARALALAGMAVASVAGLTPPEPTGAQLEADAAILAFLAKPGGDSAAAFRNGRTNGIPVKPTTGAIAGNFTGAPGSAVFIYNPGPAADGIQGIAPDALDAQGVTTEFIPKTVLGTYVPLVGDFDGNAVDDIFWYAAGRTADSIWLFGQSTGHTVVRPSVSGSYRPVVIEANGDGYDDIVWYAPGPGADSLWLFGAGGTVTAKRSLTIDGDYDLVPGHFGIRPEGSPQQRLLLNDPDGPDVMWTFDTSGGHTSASFPGRPGEPVVYERDGEGIDAILWYRAGSAAEYTTTFSSSGDPSIASSQQVWGSYDPLVGDLDGDGREDIAWTSPGRATIWATRDGAPFSFTTQLVSPETIPVVLPFPGGEPPEELARSGS